MHLHHLNHPFTNDDSGKSGFLALTLDSKLHYIEYNENHESTSPIQRIRRVNLTSPFRVSKLVGSCNGLICFARYRNPFVGICNPITREYVMLPEIKRDLTCDIDRYSYWETSFGYVSLTNQYKVVGMYMSRTKTHLEVYIYNLGSGTGWRNIGKFNSEFHIHIWDVSGFFASGALYWLDLQTIVAFDLAEEKFCGHLSPPPRPTGTGLCDSRIGVLNGFLYYAASLVVEKPVCYDIWLLKKKNDTHEMKEREEHQSLVWSKEFTVDDRRLLAVTKSDGVLTYGSYYLNIYDTETSTSKSLVEFNTWILKVSTHKNTLVSLKELGEEDTNVMESAKVVETKRWDYFIK